MPEHTPGPWFVSNVDNTGTDKTLTQCAIENGSWTIARVWNDVGGGDPEANARLIAAAPELLEAAKATLQAGFREDAFEATVEAERLLTAAVAKAEGRVNA